MEGLEIFVRDYLPILKKRKSAVVLYQLYVAMSEQINGKRMCRLTYKAIEEHTGLRVDTISKSNENLEALGLIAIEKGSENEYTILAPKSFSAKQKRYYSEKLGVQFDTEVARRLSCETELGVLLDLSKLAEAYKFLGKKDFTIYKIAEYFKIDPSKVREGMKVYWFKSAVEIALESIRSGREIDEYEEFMHTARKDGLSGVLKYFCERFYIKFGRRYCFTDNIWTGTEMSSSKRIYQAWDGDMDRIKEYIDFFLDNKVQTLPKGIISFAILASSQAINEFTTLSRSKKIKRTTKVSSEVQQKTAELGSKCLTYEDLYWLVERGNRDEVPDKSKFEEFVKWAKGRKILPPTGSLKLE